MNNLVIEWNLSFAETVTSTIIEKLYTPYYSK